MSFLNQQGAFSFSNPPSLSTLNLVLLWNVDLNHRFLRFYLACPASASPNRVSVHWIEELEFDVPPPEYLRNASEETQEVDLPITLVDDPASDIRVTND